MEKAEKRPNNSFPPIENLPSVSGWKEIPIIEPENVEKLVPLGLFSESDEIYTSSIYRGEHSNSPYPDSELDGSLLTIFVRENVARDLKTAQKMLPANMRLIVFDAYRTLVVQQALYDQYYNALAAKHPDWGPEALSTETQKYVSLPASPDLNPDTKFVSPHNTGGAVDLAIFKLPDGINEQVLALEKEISQMDQQNGRWQEIYEAQMKRISLINQNAEMLEFGTKFDYGGAEAASEYFEGMARTGQNITPEVREAVENRRLLYKVMTDAGFEAYPDEWWHFNSKKTQMGAKTAGLDHAEYGSIRISKENIDHEKMRILHRIGNLEIVEKNLAVTSKIPDETTGLTFRAARHTGDLRMTSLPQADAIKPPDN